MTCQQLSYVPEPAPTLPTK
ncbi:hypothetical protein PENVUL_c122G04935 [Penicillium vulpinum]|uniref:Uncharacterized protein n=1 Tax=Penicillium vulpinum TaxID=29845 RepID=A0A1V6R0J9_9EURO|nr:hypothetical protein PENVUL_c122G04935 [Penicillium vulpinum]